MFGVQVYMHPRLDCFHAVPVLAIAIVPNWHLLSLLNFTCMYHQERTNKDKEDILKTVSRVEYYWFANMEKYCCSR